ncbi:MAG: formylmethanofuran dehydrogenase subunit E family protein [bacterium]
MVNLRASSGSAQRLLQQATSFHGHLGPWLALGLRAGLYARRIVSADPFRLVARARCPARTPYTCLLDGIQFSSGCTLGKGNIHHLRSACRGRSRRAEVSVEFRRRDGTGTGLRLELRPELWTELHLAPVDTETAVTRLGRDVFGRPLNMLFIETRS